MMGNKKNPQSISMADVNISGNPNTVLEIVSPTLFSEASSNYFLYGDIGLFREYIYPFGYMAIAPISIHECCRLYTAGEIQEIRDTTLYDVILATTNINAGEIQRNPFIFMPG